MRLTHCIKGFSPLGELPFGISDKHLSDAKQFSSLPATVVTLLTKQTCDHVTSFRPVPKPTSHSGVLGPISRRNPLPHKGFELFHAPKPPIRADKCGKPSPSNDLHLPCPSELRSCGVRRFIAAFRSSGRRGARASGRASKLVACRNFQKAAMNRRTPNEITRAVYKRNKSAARFQINFWPPLE